MGPVLQHLVVGAIVKRHEFEVRVMKRGTKKHAACAAKAIDSDSGGHFATAKCLSLMPVFRASDMPLIAQERLRLAVSSGNIIVAIG
jgi:hypothetical protein